MLNAIRDGKPVAELENNGVTNGAAMRVSPLGCLLPARDVGSFIDDVALASSRPINPIWRLQVR
ncbi:hypothetical protein ACNKHP_22100 [Shigella boydii]